MGVMSLTLFPQQLHHNSTMSTGFTLFPARICKARSERPIVKRLSSSSPDEALQMKTHYVEHSVKPFIGERTMLKSLVELENPQSY
jgi:hypothetical protein